MKRISLKAMESQKDLGIVKTISFNRNDTSQGKTKKPCRHCTKSNDTSRLNAQNLKWSLSQVIDADANLD